MIRHAFIYGLSLAALALLLDWLQFRHMMFAHVIDVYVIGIALVFAGLGIWIGARLTPVRVGAPFERNLRAIAALGISARECEVLALLAKGHSNKAIARSLCISPNTVKTHASRLFEKLQVQSRTQAIERARALEILP